jgi:aspartate/methionine/tyrosine aminotransferase
VRLRPSRLDAFTSRLGPRTDSNLSASAAAEHSLEELLALADPEARTLWDRLSLGYASTRGDPLLRSAIASLYEEVTPEEILTFAGAQEGIFITLAALLEPGDRVVTVTPAYEALTEIPRMLGAEVVTVPLLQADRWRLDVDRLIAKIRPGTALVILNFPHNPTGAVLDPADLERILEAVERAGARLFSDEVHRLLDPAPARAAADRSPRAVSLDVMAKSFGLAGVRVGWIATRDRELIEKAMGLKGWTSICNGTPDEVLALIGIRARARILSGNLALVAENRRHFSEFITAHADLLEWVPPVAGCLAFPRFVDGRDAGDYAEALAEEARLLMIPGGLFGDYSAHFRLGLGSKGCGEALSRWNSDLPCRA